MFYLGNDDKICTMSKNLEASVKATYTIATARSMAEPTKYFKDSPADEKTLSETTNILNTTHRGRFLGRM